MASRPDLYPFSCQTTCDDGAQCPNPVDAFHRSTCEIHGSKPRTDEERAALFGEYTEHLWDHWTFYNCEFGPGGSLSWLSTKVLSRLQNLVIEERDYKSAYAIQKVQRFLWKKGDSIPRLKITVVENEFNFARDIMTWEGFTAALLENVLTEMEETKRNKAPWDWSGFSPEVYDQIKYQMGVADIYNIEFIRGDGKIVTPNW